MSFYDEIEIEDMELIDGMYYYPCPCGDQFQITLEELYDGEEVATCPSCSLIIRVIFEEEDLPSLDDAYGDSAGAEPILAAA